MSQLRDPAVDTGMVESNCICRRPLLRRTLIPLLSGNLGSYTPGNADLDGVCAAGSAAN